MFGSRKGLKLLKTLQQKIITAFLLVSVWVSPFISIGQAEPINKADLLSPSSDTTGSQVIHVPGDVANLQDAINQAPDGAIIELAGGTYRAPEDGFKMFDLGKGFTIRAAKGATVVLDGGGDDIILRFQNSSKDAGGPVVFKGLTFANGHTTSEGLAGGVTMYEAEATFIDCVFQGNSANVSSTVGGAVYVAEHSIAFFVNTTWENNQSRMGGGALGIRSGSMVYIHASKFTSNSANPPNHDPGASGGAINMGNSDLRISNTRFEGNQAGAYGAALYGIGNWSDPVSTPRATILISNSTFIDNQAVRDSSVNASFPTEGGAINVENQLKLKIYSSRFITNSANIGGGVNVYRADVEIYGSVFQGNQANGQVFSSSFGGSISLNSSDTADDGNNNRPPAKLVLQDSLIQGRYGSVKTVAQTGGCLFSGGDSPRIDGDPGVQDMGSVDENRVQVTVKRSAFYDCDTKAASPNSSIGGAIEVTVADFTLADSLVANSDALGDSASGGGIAILFQSDASITNTTFANNTVGKFGGALFVQGSTIHLSDSNLIENEVSPGVSESENASYGAAVFATPDEGRNLNVGGVIENNTFSLNDGMTIFDDDRSNGPINDVRYNGNQFYATSFNGKVYKDSLSSSQTASGLNSLVVTRSNGTSTAKSQSDNKTLRSAPALGAILAVPPAVYPTSAQGDPSPPTGAYLGYASSGGSVSLDGVKMSSNTGLEEKTESGEYKLTVGGASFSTKVDSGAKPQATFTTSSDGSSKTLSWNVTKGTFLDCAIDQGVDIDPAKSGSVQVPSGGNRDYLFYAITKEGGVVVGTDSTSPVLALSDTFHVLAGLNLNTNYGYLPIFNGGGGTLNWTAKSASPNLIQVETTSSKTIDGDVISLKLITKGLSPGNYTGYVDIDAGEAGSQRVAISIKVVKKIYFIYVPAIRN